MIYDDLSKKKSHFREKYLVLSYLTWENTLSDYGSVAGHRNLNETEHSPIARYRNFNAPKICKITVYQPSNVTLADLGASISELTQRNLDLLKRPRESLQVFQNYIPTYDDGQLQAKTINSDLLWTFSKRSYLRFEVKIRTGRQAATNGASHYF